MQTHIQNMKKFDLVAMGGTFDFIHKGHITLIEKAKENSDLVICSIFVNPIQFNNFKDLKNYPQTIKSDFEKFDIHVASQITYFSRKLPKQLLAVLKNRKISKYLGLMCLLDPKCFWE